jgi:hypothetical protein
MAAQTCRWESMARRKPTAGRARRQELDLAASSDPAAEEPAERDIEVTDDRSAEDGIDQLYAYDSAALELWKDRLSQYVDAQGALDALRLRPCSEQPWPAANNPMLGYLIERSIEIADEDGLGAAVAWLAANSWFEGAIAERSRFVRLLDAD